MKSTWKEKLSPESSPPSEVEVLNLLPKTKPYDSDNAIVRDDGNLEVETCTFPKNCEIALPASTGSLMEKMQSSYASGHTPKPMAPGATKRPAGEPLLGRAKIQRQQFNEPLEVRRLLTCILVSYCTPLGDAMHNAGPKTLMRIIRDAMIVYYEAYKLPDSGFIHGGKHFARCFGMLGANDQLV
jgi:hypothetical protein